MIDCKTCMAAPALSMHQPRKIGPSPSRSLWAWGNRHFQVNILAEMATKVSSVYEASSKLAKYPFEPYWPSKLKICVTGAGGFIASYVAPLYADWRSWMWPFVPIRRHWPVSKPHEIPMQRALAGRVRVFLVRFAFFPPHLCTLVPMCVASVLTKVSSRFLLLPSTKRRHLAKRLKSEGHYIVACDWKRNEHMPENVFCDEFVLVDLRLFENCAKVVEGCDHVFNLAADMGGMGFIQSNHSVIMYNNTMISFNVMEASRIAKVQRLFYASSACIYPEGKQLETEVEGGGLKEDDAWPAQPQDAYGLEKLASEELCIHYNKDFDIECRIAVRVAWAVFHVRLSAFGIRQERMQITPRTHFFDNSQYRSVSITFTDPTEPGREEGRRPRLPSAARSSPPLTRSRCGEMESRRGLSPSLMTAWRESCVSPSRITGCPSTSDRTRWSR